MQVSILSTRENEHNRLYRRKRHLGRPAIPRETQHVDN